jgi:hypothetical protein
LGVTTKGAIPTLSSGTAVLAKTPAGVFSLALDKAEVLAQPAEETSSIIIKHIKSAFFSIRISSINIVFHIIIYYLVEYGKICG